MRPVVEFAFQMNELKRRLNSDLSRIEEEFGITKEHLQSFADDSWIQIRRSELQILVGLAKRSGMDLDRFITVRTPHPIWESFDRTATSIFRARSAPDAVVTEDAEIVQELRREMDLSSVDEQVHNLEDTTDCRDFQSCRATVILTPSRH